MAVLLEELRSQMNVVLEAVQGCATKTELREFRADVLEAIQQCATKTELRDLRADMNARFDVLTAEVARKAESAALEALERSHH